MGSAASMPLSLRATYPLRETFPPDSQSGRSFWAADTKSGFFGRSETVLMRRLDPLGKRTPLNPGATDEAVAPSRLEGSTTAPPNR